MRVVVFNPLAAGLLTGRYKRKEDIMNSEHGRFSPEFDFIPGHVSSHALKGVGHKLYRERYSSDRLILAIGRISQAVEKDSARIPMAEATLRWILHHSQLSFARFGDGIIFGSSSIRQSESNFNACLLGALPKAIADAYAEASDIVGPSEPYLRGYDPKPGKSDAYLAKF